VGARLWSESMYQNRRKLFKPLRKTSLRFLRDFNSYKYLKNSHSSNSSGLIIAMLNRKFNNARKLHSCILLLLLLLLLLFLLERICILLDRFMKMINFLPLSSQELKLARRDPVRLYCRSLIHAISTMQRCNFRNVIVNSVLIKLN